MAAWRLLDSDKPAANFNLEDFVTLADPDHKKKKVSKSDTCATFVTHQHGANPIDQVAEYQARADVKSQAALSDVMSTYQ